MRGLVTGANGFIGSHVCELLLERGHRVRGLVRRTSDLTWLEGLDLELCYGDLRERESLAPALADVDWVFHAAAVVRPKDPADFERVNYLGTKELVQACAAAGVKRFVLFSSAAAAGPADGRSQPKTETDPAEPVSRYGLGKLKAEQAVLEFKDVLCSVILRFPAVYGPRDRDSLLLLRNLRRGFVPVLGAEFSVVHAKDAARAALLAAECDVSSGSVFFISDGYCHSYEEVGRLAASLLGRRVRPVRVPGWAVKAAARVSEWLSREGSILNPDKAQELVQRCWVCSPDKARQVLGFEPEYPLEKGLRETFEWCQKREWL